MNKFRVLLVVLLCTIFLSSCIFKGKDRGSSSTTGWAYNDPDFGGFEVQESVEQMTGPGLVLIEGGRFTMGQVSQDVFFDWNNKPRTVTVSSFYMVEKRLYRLS